MQLRIRAVLAILTAAGCGAPAAKPRTPPPGAGASIARGEDPPTLDARFVAGLRETAAQYRRWGRLDESPNLAPVLCRMPMPGDYGSPAQVRMSHAGGEAHGQKLYYLWASSKSDYARVSRGASAAVPVGFTIVKEAFAATTSEPTARIRPDEPGQRFLDSDPPPAIDHLATDRGTLWVGEPRGLYVMTKVADAAVDGTDAGWIYGTITPDGTVTSAGRVGSCMRCHETTGHDRLFGVEP